MGLMGLIVEGTLDMAMFCKDLFIFSLLLLWLKYPINSVVQGCTVTSRSLIICEGNTKIESDDSAD